MRLSVSLDKIFEHYMNVEFCDVNQDNKITNKGLLRFCQEASNCHSAAVGYGIHNDRKIVYNWVLINQKLEVFERPSWYTKLKIKTWSRGAKGVCFLRDFEIWDEKENLVCVASSRWVMVERESGKILRPVQQILDAYGTYVRSVFEGKSKKLQEPSNSIKNFEYKVQNRDIDVNGHVNNLCYLDFAEETVPENVSFNSFSTVEVLYKKEIKLHEVVSGFYFENESEFIVTIKSNNDDSVNAILKLSNYKL